jgi:hypothetical protein
MGHEMVSGPGILLHSPSMGSPLLASAPPVVISASRRTDIARFYAEWFSARRAAGFAQFANVFGVHGQVSLVPRDVLGYLFWTRDPSPLRRELRALRQAQIPYAFQFTITAYGPDLERRRPPLDYAIGQFLQVSRTLPSPESIQWRYDPIVISARYPASFHTQAFARIADRLAGATRVVNTSLVEPYRAAVRRLADPSVLYRAVDPKRHAAVFKSTPELAVAGDHGRSLAAELSLIAHRCGMELRACANPDLGLPPSQCCGTELFLAYGSDVVRGISAQGRAPSRSGCRCLRSIDIGMNETCRGGCQYCYVVRSERAAAIHAAEHRPQAPWLRPLPGRHAGS